MRVGTVISHYHPTSHTSKDFCPSRSQQVMRIKKIISPSSPQKTLPVGTVDSPHSQINTVCRYCYFAPFLKSTTSRDCYLTPPHPNKHCDSRLLSFPPTKKIIKLPAGTVISPPYSAKQTLLVGTVISAPPPPKKYQNKRCVSGLLFPSQINISRRGFF